MKPVCFTFLNGSDIGQLELTDTEILDAVEQGLRAQGQGETVIEPRVHLVPDASFNGHFNVLRGYVAPLSLAGVKIVGDFVGNYEAGLPSEMALLNLFDPRTGMPVAVVDATALTEMRTGALTALGARHLARPDAGVLGHIGARATSYWNVRLLDRIFDLAEIRVHSRRPESRAAFAERLERDLGKPVVVTKDWQRCVEGADIVVEASRLERPEPLLKTEWIARGALVVPYGTNSAVELGLTDIWTRSSSTTGGRHTPDRSAPCAPTWTPAGSTRPICTASWARSSRAASPAGRARRRRTCSGTAVSPSPTSRSAPRC
ncbi:ornithine cyclodeaminase family protein [Streptomyces sp. ADMS]|nr:ornithine cyclodeaminase family protein [Streptomyces sp. ADMS]MDW4909293.1 ornithine cyclodeaminase family protein [Streptomyces sp. ADMS]